MNSYKVCITTKSALASLLFKGLVTKHRTVKWSIEEQRVELDALTLSVKEAQDKNRTLEAELHAAVRKTDEQKEEIAELYFLQDNLEQYTRKQSLELCGIPDSAYTSTEEAVLQLAEKLDVPMVSQRI